MEWLETAVVLPSAGIGQCALAGGMAVNRAHCDCLGAVGTISPTPVLGPLFESEWEDWEVGRSGRDSSEVEVERGGGELGRIGVSSSEAELSSSEPELLG